MARRLLPTFLVTILGCGAPPGADAGVVDAAPAPADAPRAAEDARAPTDLSALPTDAWSFVPIDGAVCGNWWKGARMGHPEGFAVLSVDGERITWSYQTFGFVAGTAG